METKDSLNKVVITLLLSLVFSCILAFGYSYVIDFMPFVYLNLFITFFFGGFTTIFVYQAVKTGKIKSKANITIVSLISVIFAYYLHWAVYCSLNSTAITSDDMLLQLSTTNVLENGFTTSHSTWYYITHPMQLISTLNEISKDGLWTFKGIEVNGIILVIVWLIEAFVVFGTALFMPLDMLKKSLEEKKTS